MKHIGIFMNLAENDPEIPIRLKAFKEGLNRTDVDFQFRFGGANYDKYDNLANELIGLQPDVLVATCGPTFWAFQQQNLAIPMVYTAMVDPMRTKVTFSGEAAGFTSYELDISKDWVELLKEMVPGITRMAMITDLKRHAGDGHLGDGKLACGTTIRMTGIDINDTDAAIESAVAAFANDPTPGGLVVPTSTKGAVRRKLIIGLAAKHNLPAIYSNRLYMNSGGLFSYGARTLDLYRAAGQYADRILNGEPPHQLGQQKADRGKFELIINTTVAKAIGVTVPPALLARANEVMT
jgi:ABC-type uncharacterized transport system substrate-binding protein